MCSCSGTPATATWSARACARDRSLKESSCRGAGRSPMRAACRSRASNASISEAGSSRTRWRCRRSAPLSVLFTDTVLDRFDQQELLAICAHELAHFEHYNPGYLRRWNLVTYSLIALGAACTPVARITGLDSGLCPAFCGSRAIVVSTAVRARGKQRQETTCDLRAVELTGDADALVRGSDQAPHGCARAAPDRAAGGTVRNPSESGAAHPRHTEGRRRRAGHARRRAKLHQRRRPQRRHLRRRGVAVGRARWRDAPHQLRPRDRAATSIVRSTPRPPPRRARRRSEALGDVTRRR